MGRCDSLTGIDLRLVRHLLVALYHRDILCPSCCDKQTSVHNMRARCSSVVRAFAHGAMGRQIDPSWGGPIELFLVSASAPRLV